MSEERRDRRWALFDQAADLPPAEQRALLDAACPDDPALRAEVEKLLADDARLRADQAATSFLNSPLVRAPAPTPAADTAVLPDRPLPPAYIGRYRIVSLLGEGGMGAVYLAEQDNPRRPVALKVIRPGLVSPALLKRFAQEAHILGRLQHVGIAQIYEAGVAQDGRPFFAMEYICGVPLDEYARGLRLDPAARLALLARVCDAVQHAHERGVIHRDLKPGNVLVDAADQPKVLDFGIARATDADVQTTAGRTEAGQLLGTLNYMSPEQVTADPAALDVRSDVYTLGVILFELLADRLPYPLAHLPLPEVARVIREREPPRLGSINPRFRGDVETIVIRALEKDKVRRYASAGELAADIRRHLKHEPIRARRTSAAERLVRWTRRNKALAAALAAVALLLVLISAVSIALAVYYRQQETVQRGLVEEKTALATRNQQLADEARAALHQAETTLVDMQVSHGLLAGERGDAAAALSWFAAAAKQAASDPPREADNRLRARNWARTVVLPVGVFSLGLLPRKVAFQPSGDLLLMLTGTGRLFIWDWRQDRLVYRSDDQRGVSAACWSPDGESFALASASDVVQPGVHPSPLGGLLRFALGTPSGVVQVRKARDGALVHTLKHPGAVTALAFSPDGRYLAVASDVVRLWDAQAQRFLEAAWKHPKAVGALAFNRKGDRLVTACADNQARLYAVGGPPGRPAPLFDPVPHSPAYGYASPPAFVDGDRGLVTITGNQQLTWWDADGMKKAPAGDIATKSYGLSRVVASPRGDWFATGGFSVAQVWNCAAGTARSLVLEHLNFVEDLAFSTDGTTLLTICWDETARLWSLPEGHPIGNPLPHMGMVTRGDLSGDARHVATTQQDGLVRVWERPVEGKAQSLEAAQGRRLRVSSDGRLAAPGIWHEEPAPYVVPDAQQAQVIDVTAGKPAGPVQALPGVLIDSCVCADNRSAAAVSRDGDNGWLSVWDVATGRLPFKPRKLPGPPAGVAARPRGSHLAVLCKTGDLLVFDVPTGAQLFALRHEGGWNRMDERWSRVEYTPDGATLLSVGDGYHNTVCVRDADTGRLRFTPLRPVLGNGCCRSLAISADSRLLATAVTGKNAAQVWDLADGRARCAPIPHAGDYYGLFHISFSPDGRRILTSSKNGLALLWDWQAGHLACPPLKHRDEVFAGWITPDGGHAVTACRGTSGSLYVWELTTGKPVAPPLRLAPTADPNLAPAHVTLSPDGKQAFASVPRLGFLGQVRLADLLDPPELSTQDLVLLGELASFQRIESGAESRLTTEKWLERWERFRQKYPRFGRAASREAPPARVGP
jgi:WD40 repeat protein/predicted Ser/Thr protein kinase